MDRSSTSFWTVLLFALALIGAGCHTAGSAHHFEKGTPVLILGLHDDGSVSFADSTATYRAGTSQVTQASDGPAKIRSAMQGSYIAEPLVFQSAPAKADYWIDLSQPIAGTIFTGSDTQGLELGKFEVEWFVDGASAGGIRFDHTPDTTGATWNAINLAFHPEVRMIPKGAVVEVHVTQLTGLGDWHLGTGGEANSHLAVPYSPIDPLTGALFLEDGVLLKTPTPRNTTEDLEDLEAFAASPTFDDLEPGFYTIPTPDEDEDGGIGVAVMAAIAVLPAIGLLGLGGRLRGRGLVALMLVAVALSGCAKTGDGFDPGSLQESTLNIEHRDLPKEAGKEHPVGAGGVQGIVLDRQGDPIPGANVFFEGTRLLEKTADDGTFAFQGLFFGEYVVRIEARDLMSLRETVHVREGKITFIEAYLLPPAFSGRDDAPHQHDVWGNETVRLADKTGPFQVATEASSVSEDTGSTSHCIGISSANGAENGQRRDTACIWPIPTTPALQILPGTHAVQVTLDWDAQAPNAPQELGIQFQNPASRLAVYNELLPRGPGEVFTIEMFPHWADRGHMQTSDWQFFVTGPRSDVTAPWQKPLYEMPPISAEIHILKGVVPYEQAHSDPWGNQTRFQVTDPNLTKAFSCYCLESDGQAEADGWRSHNVVWEPALGAWVPQGTDRLVGTVTAEHKVGNQIPLAPPHVEYAIGYKPANIPTERAGGNLIVIDDTQITSTGWTFTIWPEPAQLDPWYAQEAGWEFYLLTRSDVTPYWTNARFSLDVQAIKDPAWQATP